MATKRLQRLYRAQASRCHWCGAVMLPPGTHRPARGVPTPATLATLDHLRDRLAELLRWPVAHQDAVAACFRCNSARGLLRQALTYLPLVRTHYTKAARATRPASSSSAEAPIAGSSSPRP